MNLTVDSRHLITHFVKTWEPGTIGLHHSTTPGLLYEIIKYWYWIISCNKCIIASLMIKKNISRLTYQDQGSVETLSHSPSGTLVRNLSPLVRCPQNPLHGILYTAQPICYILLSDDLFSQLKGFKFYEGWNPNLVQHCQVFGQSQYLPPLLALTIP